jgi:hypothetical protein
MLTITSHKGNANQNHTNIILRTFLKEEIQMAK